MSGAAIAPGAAIVVETERIILRHWREGDIELWLEHLNTPEVRRHLGGVETPEKVAEKFARVERGWAEDGFAFLAVDRCEDGEFLGTCGIVRIKTECAPPELKGAIQVGWQFREDCWGQGYATEAAEAMLAMAFEEFNFPTVYAQTSERNVASWRVMERLGMTRLAGFDYDDPAFPPEETPTIVYGLTREEWRAGRQSAAQ